MAATVQVGTITLVPNAERMVASVPWSPAVDVYVDASIDKNLLGSIWSVYAVTGAFKTKLASGSLSQLAGQRVLAGVPGLGATIELWAKSLVPTLLPATGALVGYNPREMPVPPALPDDEADFAGVVLVSGVATTLGTVAWHPRVQVLVADPCPKGVLFDVQAVIAGFTAKITVAGAAYDDTQTGRPVVNAFGGASSWSLLAMSPVGATPAFNASFFAYSESGAGGGNVPPTGVVQYLEIPVGHGPGPANAQSVTVLPANSIVLRASLLVVTAYVPAESLVLIGNLDDLEAYYFSTGTVLLDQGALFQEDQRTPNVTPSSVLVQILDPGNVGACVVMVEYCTAPNT